VFLGAYQTQAGMVAVSPNVADNYVRFGGYGGPLAVISNGCDFEYWHNTGAHEFSPQASGRPVAFHQGRINDELDYHLIHKLLHCLPDWDFWFCGRLDPRQAAWKLLLDRTNFVHYGQVNLERVAELSKSAHVGLMPFVDDVMIHDSWRLKAFEYVACGLGVVTVEIDALRSFPEQVKIAKTAETFR
jgi:glycosyltransferase involved in cell wall biosynthesis